jgi:gliding motility-associated-like protein
MSVSGDLFLGSVTSNLKGVGSLLAVGLDRSVLEFKPAINVFNAVSPNGDNLHDFLKIENIGAYPDNTVIIYNRQGAKVFEIIGYDNVNNVFIGESNVNQFGILPSGTYYYWLDRGDGSKTTSGFFVLNR